MRIFIFLFLGMLPIAVLAEDTVRVQAPIQKATVYFGYGAELSHKSKASIQADTRILILDQLSTTVDLQSLQVSLPGDIAILSQRFEVFAPPAPIIAKSKEWLYWEDSLERLKTSWSRLENREKIEEETLKSTGKLIEMALEGSAPNSVRSAEVLRLVDYYNERIEKGRNEIFALLQQKKRNQLEQAGVREKIKALQEKSPLAPKPYGRVILQIKGKKMGEMPISLSYYTSRAGWTPSYDVRVNSQTNKVQLVYKATISQTSGVDWKNTKLVLSTGTPNFGVSAPVLSPWYLQLYVPQLYNQLQGKAPGINLHRNAIQSFDKDAALNEVVIIRGASNYQEEYADTSRPYTLEDFTSLQQGQLNTNFEIDLPYDITGDGELHAVNIREEEIQTVLKNYAVPRLEQEAYLLAEVPDWQNLDLLPGDANIIMDDTYIGKSLIDPNSTADTLNLSLGKDKRLQVKRGTVKELSSLKSSGGYQRQTFTYEIKVKNTKLTEVNALVKDQIPLSQIKEVEVKLEDNGGAAYNEEVGVLTWKLQLKPGESRSLRFSYTIKYPKGKRIVNMK